MSLTIDSSAWLLDWIVSAHSRWSGLSGVSSSRLDIPITPFIGVRISWLMLARNSDLAWSASCALTARSSARRTASSSAWLVARSRV